ncbi:MAG: phosphatase PAP2 family protein [Alphaproteobacteria bacterium]|nr:phosphatase PAP2 family protein [Alphaproteobacteria bacterium]
MLRKLLFVALAITLTACGSKYPYSPNYVSPDTVSVRSIPVPPAPYSKEWYRDVDTVIASQQNLSAETIAQIKAEKPVLPEMLATDVLGAKVTAANYPVLFEFLKRTGSDSWRISDVTKDYWGTTRPYLMDKRIHLYAEPITSHAYPSGHTTTNFVWAELLSELVPNAREALYARALEVAQHRVKGGVHYPHDLQGGQLLAREIVAKMKTIPQFQKDLNCVKTELRKQPIAYKKSCCKSHCKRKR